MGRLVKCGTISGLLYGDSDDGSMHGHIYGIYGVWHQRGGGGVGGEERDAQLYACVLRLEKA